MHKEKEKENNLKKCCFLDCGSQHNNSATYSVDGSGTAFIVPPAYFSEDGQINVYMSKVEDSKQTYQSKKRATVFSEVRTQVQRRNKRIYFIKCFIL